jgi:two-component system sensor histidine kinase KdpD
MNNPLFRVPSLRNQYLLSVVIIIGAALACFGFSQLMGYRVVALVLLFTVSLLAVSFDILPVLLSACLSAFIWDFFFIPPRFTIHVNTTEDSILVIMYFVVAMINAVLTYKIRQIEKEVNLKEEKANSVKLYNTILNSLSHELRTPLAAIIGAADNLQTNQNLNENEKNQLVGEISKASLRLNQQVENLLNISRLESGHIKPKTEWCDVVELVYDTVNRVEENNPHRKINIHINQQFPQCSIDKGMLEQIIYNLLNNAAIHTDTKTRIDISAFIHADLLEVVVEDNGQGFQDINANDVFDKFSRIKDTSPGSGLGLSIVKGFTEALGGVVGLENSKGKGTRFTISFPVKTLI